LTARPYELSPGLQIEDCLPAAEPGRAVTAAASLLSNLWQFAGVVLTPKRTQVVRHIEFIRLSDRRVLLIAVPPNGGVYHRILVVAREYSVAALLEASNFFIRHFSGKSFHAVRLALADELALLRSDISRLMQHALDAGLDSPDTDDVAVVI